jgi:hypothetical protein
VIDCVYSYHGHPLSCGVTKFNVQLAQKLGVPHVVGLADLDAKYPLLSIKWSEISPRDQKGLRFWCATNRYQLLWHDEGDAGLSAAADSLQHASVLGCPATIQGDATRGTIDVLTFGMAHKVNEPHLRRLKGLLDQTGQSYTISLSSAIHAGDAWEARLDASTALFRDIFGSHLRVMGFLADDAIARLLEHVTHVAVFYDPAARANHTTLWAALEAGVPTITNLDQDSPAELKHEVSVYDLNALREFPMFADRHRVVRAGGVAAASRYSWDRLLGYLHLSEVGA